MMDLVKKEELERNYRVFKGYSVKLKSKKEEVKEHYVVPWEMAHEECKKTFH